MSRYIKTLALLFIVFASFTFTTDVVYGATYQENFDSSSGVGSNTIFTIRTGRLGTDPDNEGVLCASPVYCVKSSTNFGTLGVWAFSAEVTSSGRMSVDGKSENNSADLWFYFHGQQVAIYDGAGTFSLNGYGGTSGSAPISLLQNVWHDLEFAYRTHSSGNWEFQVCADDACSDWSLSTIPAVASTTVGFTGTGGGTGASEIWIDNFLLQTDLAPDFPDYLFGFTGTTTAITQLNYPPNNMLGATTTVSFSFDYLIGSDWVPTHVGVEWDRYFPNGYTGVPIEEEVVSSGASTFTGDISIDGVGDDFYRWRGYLRDSNGQKRVTSEWRHFTSSTTTYPSDPLSTPAWEVWYEYSSTTVSSTDSTVNLAYSRCEEFDDNILGFVSTPICKFFVFLVVPQNASTMIDGLKSNLFSRVPFSYVASVTDTVTSARSEYYSSEATFPDFVINTGTSSAIDIEFAVLSKTNIEELAGENTIPQFRIIMEYFLWLSFIAYAFFFAINELKRLTS